MTIKFKPVLTHLRRLSVFDWLAVLAISSTVVFLALFILKEERWVKVEVKIAPKEWWRDNQRPPYWLSSVPRKGDKQYDIFGRKVAEVLDVRNYEGVGGRNSTYLYLNLKVEIDKRKRQYKFNHLPAEVGSQIDLQLGGAEMPGLVTHIEGMPDTRTWEEKTVEARLVDNNGVFPETLGVQPWVADEVKSGDKMKDTQGRVIAEVLEKRVSQAEKIITTADGRVFVSQDPIKKDVTLVLRLMTYKAGGVNYFLDDIKVKVNQGLFLSLPSIDLFPIITKTLH